MNSKTWKNELAEALAIASEVSLESKIRPQVAANCATHIDFEKERKVDDHFYYVVSASIGLQDVISSTEYGEERPKQCCTDAPYEVHLRAFSGTIAEVRGYSLLTLQGFKETVEKLVSVRAVKYQLSEEIARSGEFQPEGYGFTWGEDQYLIPAKKNQENVFQNLQPLHKGHFSKIMSLERV